MVRTVKPADVRLNRYGNIVTAPAWAYRGGRDGRAKPIPAAWRDVLRVLQRRADARYERQLADYERRLAEYEQRLAEPNPERWGALTRHPPWKPVRWKVRPPTARTADVKTCAVCHGEFYGVTIYTCSAACEKAWRSRFYRRPSRAKPRQKARCPVCGDEFRQTRRDAKFCGVRCRVEAHRAAKASGDVPDTAVAGGSG
jgi:hypothetical protein